MPSSLGYTHRLIAKTSPLKVWNGLQLLISYHLSRWLKLNLHRGFPISFAIEPTTACNLGCPECPSGMKSFTRPTGNLQPGDFKFLVDQLKHRVSYLTFYFQGEPYLNANFLDMVKYANDNKLITSTSTNAHFLNSETARKTVESGLDRLIISIDGTDQDTYGAYRKNGKLERVIEGTKNIIYWKRELKSLSPQVVFQFLVVRPNEHQLEKVKELGRELGVDKVVFKTAQVYNFENGHELIPENIKYSRYRKNRDGSWSVKNKLLNQCWRMWSSCVLTWDGDVVPCCFDKDAKHKLGNAAKHSFDEIWYGTAYRRFRKSILHGRDQIDICRNCSEGTRVWVN